MIEELHISGLGVIEDASLRLSPGLTVVTGETGAGKTMLVTALQLLLGERSDSALVRAGAEAALVDAIVAPAPPTASEWGGGEELVVSREIPADGRSRARINGRLAPVSALAEVLGSWVEVHAQGEHARLSRPDVQRNLLDQFAGDPHARTLTVYREAYRAWRDTVGRIDQLEDDARERAREIDRLRHEVGEIAQARLDPDTDSRLAEDLALLEHAEELHLAMAQASAALGAEGAGDPLGVAVETLRRLRLEDRDLADLQQRAVGLAAEATDLAADLRRFGESIEADPERLEELRQRQVLLTGLERKYGDGVDAILAYERDAAARLSTLEQEETDAAGLHELAATQEAEARRLAADVTRGRHAAAERLAATVTGHLADLAMPHAAFTVAIEEAPALGTDGADRITFLLAANPGEPAAPLARAASGGERSRVSLAVEVALADVDDARVLVFDEVDAGIGGATAMAVGEKLARLAAGGRDRGGRQVLCVTHLAQLAAFADAHYVVEKGLSGGRTVTTGRQVAEDDRVAELSRMLSGDATREAARRHAQDLLTDARSRRAG